MPARWLIMLSLTLALCAEVALAAAAQRTPTGQVVVALSTDVPTLDPHMHNVRVMLIVGWHLFDSLTARAPTTMKPVPHLAESWRLVDDLTWEFVLRQGVKFHNGEPFNAATVKYNLARLMNPDQKSPQRGNIAWLDMVDIVDDYTVRLLTREPHPIVPEQLTNFQMIPAAYAMRVGDQEIAKQPIGTGPYRFVSWTKGQQIVLEANPDYWNGPPAVKTVIFRTIPEMAEQIAALLAGNVDIVRTIPPDQIPAIEAAGTAYVSKAPILRVVYISFDCLGREPTSQTALKDVRVRQAIAHAIDVDAIIHHVLGGLAVRTATGVTPMHFGYDSNTAKYPYDPAKAKALLAEAGYADGLQLNFHTYGGSIVSQRQVTEAIMGYLAHVGIRTDNRHFDDVGTFANLQQAGKLNDLALNSWGSYSIFDADMLLHPLFHRSEPFAYCTDAQLEALLEKGRSSLDQDLRRQLLRQAQQAIIEQAYWVPLYGQYEILGVSKRLNYQAAGDEIIRVFDVTWRE
ncbi:MAG TPA: ABC transporter substrate-binding protein [Candidatus Tectomicrobia bacterium]|nr:ABC transporter substrate-binding protein [Candidatus Tectomicrobia bacterium]